jgi:hypothetical protein
MPPSHASVPSTQCTEVPITVHVLAEPVDARTVRKSSLFAVLVYISLTC